MKPNASAQKVLDRINADELVKVALDLGNIDSPTGREGEVGQYVYDWLHRHGFAPRKLGLFPDRFNVAATLPGQARGPSLVFNSHMDTTIAKEEVWTTRRAADPIFHSARRRPGPDPVPGSGPPDRGTSRRGASARPRRPVRDLARGCAPAAPRAGADGGLTPGGQWPGGPIRSRTSIRPLVDEPQPCT